MGDVLFFSCPPALFARVDGCEHVFSDLDSIVCEGMKWDAYGWMGILSLWVEVGGEGFVLGHRSVGLGYMRLCCGACLVGR